MTEIYDSLISELRFQIAEFRHRLISENGPRYDPKITAYVGLDQWHVIRMCYNGAPPIVPELFGVRVVRVIETDYFKLVDETASPQGAKQQRT